VGNCTEFDLLGKFALALLTRPSLGEEEGADKTLPLRPRLLVVVVGMGRCESDAVIPNPVFFFIFIVGLVCV
jgi:hypothetical protein